MPSYVLTTCKLATWRPTWYLHSVQQDVLVSLDSNLLIGARVAAEDIKNPTGMLKSLATVVALHDADHLRSNLARVFQSAHLREHR